ncbi:MAG: hypothetical protein JWM21_298 [Acidobacteria bacterium]|nr:hypothetical protein [Acidobacteriota bacterium]
MPPSRQLSTLKLFQGAGFVLLLSFHSSNAAAQTSSNNTIQELSAEQTVEREMTGGATHRYQFDLRANQFFQVRVEQRGIDVALRLIDDKGDTTATMDSPNEKEGPETLSFVAERPGHFVLEVTSIDAKAEKGGYTIRREPSRIATANDRRRVEVERSFVAAIKARDSGADFDTLTTKLSEALAGWEQMGDGYMTDLTRRLVRQVIQAKSMSEIKPLPVGETVERQLEGGAGNFYFVSLKQGQVLQLDVKSNGINVLLVVGTKPEQMHAIDMGLSYERETFSLVVEEDANYLVLVRVPDFKSTGTYQLTSQVKERANATDRERIQAASLLQDGLVSSSKATAEGLAESLRFLAQAQELWEKIGDQYWSAYTSAHMGSVYADLGDHQKALIHLNGALKLFEGAGDIEGQGTTLNNIGLLYSSAGEKRKALDYYDRSLSLFRSEGNKISEGMTQNNIGTVYDDLGEKLEAAKSYSQALLLFESLDNKYGQTLALNNLGKVYAEMGDARKGLEYLNRSLTIAKETNNKLGEAATLANIQSVTNDGDPKNGSVENLLKSLQLARDIGNRVAEGKVLSNIGYVYFYAGEYQKGVDYFNQSLPLLREVGNKEREAEILNNEMVAWEFLGNRRLATCYGKQAINKFQELRSSVRGLQTEIEKSYLRTMEAYYKSLIELMIMEGRADDTIEVLNLYRDQQFFDFNPTDETVARRLSLSPREENFAREYEAKISKIGEVNTQVEDLKRLFGNRVISEQESTQLQHLITDQKGANDRFFNLLKDAEKEFAKPPGAEDSVPISSELKQMHLVLRELSASTKQKTAILYTIIRSDALFVVMVTDEAVKTFKTTVKAGDLNAKILAFYRLLRNPRVDPRPLGKELYDIIFKPVDADLTKLGVRTLVWQVDGSLRYVALPALWDGRHYLVERFEHVAFTRADLERMSRTVSPTWTATGFGNSQAQTVNLRDGSKVSFGALPGVAEELNSIIHTNGRDKGLLEGQVLTGASFTRDAFFQALKQHRPLVHIASHFAFRPGDSSRSFLLLGDGTALTLDEMKAHEHLFEGVELLTLSACNTAATEPDANGREIDGFSELAQRLGAAAVMASLWSVADKSTELLMSEFYRLRKENPQMSKAGALQSAQRSMLDGKLRPLKTTRQQRAELITTESSRALKFPFDPEKPYAHPFYWAPFVLIGNWK